MISKTGIVLTLFCGLLLVQAACATGWLPHCDHPADQAHGRDHCPDDHCRDDFPVPGKVSPPALQAAFPMAQASCRLAAIPAPAPGLRVDDRPRTPLASRPCGSFPLLI